MVVLSLTCPECTPPPPKDSWDSLRHPVVNGDRKWMDHKHKTIEVKRLLSRTLLRVHSRTVMQLSGMASGTHTHPVGSQFGLGFHWMRVCSRSGCAARLLHAPSTDICAPRQRYALWEQSTSGHWTQKTDEVPLCVNNSGEYNRMKFI